MAWVRCVSSAILAGLVARMIVVPTGALAGVGAPSRYAAMAAAGVAYFVFRRSLGAGVIAGGLVLAVGHYLID